MTSFVERLEPAEIIGGYRIIRVSPMIRVDRSWRERLFTLPWRPLDTKKWVSNPAAPYPGESYIMPGSADMLVVREEDYEWYVWLVRTLQHYEAQIIPPKPLC